MSTHGSRRLFLALVAVLGACAREDAAAVAPRPPDPPPREELAQQLELHLAKVKVSNPGQTREMTERAGGRVDTCVACHVDLAPRQ